MDKHISIGATVIVVALIGGVTANLAVNKLAETARFNICVQTLSGDNNLKFEQAVDNCLQKLQQK